MIQQRLISQRKLQQGCKIFEVVNKNLNKYENAYEYNNGNGLFVEIIQLIFEFICDETHLFKFLYVVNKLGYTWYTLDVLAISFAYVPQHCITCYLDHQKYDHFKQCIKNALSDALYELYNYYGTHQIVDSILEFVKINNKCKQCAQHIDIDSFHSFMDTCVNCNVIFCGNCELNKDKYDYIRATEDGMFIYLDFN